MCDGIKELLDLLQLLSKTPGVRQPWHKSKAPTRALITGSYLRWCVVAHVQDIIPADRIATVAHLPGIEKLLRCMLVRDPVRRATLADVSRRHAQFLNPVSHALSAWPSQSETQSP